VDELKTYIRAIPDYPKPGIRFYDLTTLIQDPRGFNRALDGMEAFVKSSKPDRILAVESRGFIFGAALADRLDISLVLARKPGKLPSKTISESYDLEYGTDSLEIHADAIEKGDRVVLVDDLIATGGTLEACGRLVERLGGEVVGISAVVALVFLPFEERLSKYDVNYLVSYASE
jgi:adenine phosphoribosyltransferase